MSARKATVDAFPASRKAQTLEGMGEKHSRSKLARAERT